MEESSIKVGISTKPGMINSAPDLIFLVYFPHLFNIIIFWENLLDIQNSNRNEEYISNFDIINSLTFR